MNGLVGLTVCFAIASGWTSGSARKNARNARNGPVTDKEIPYSRHKPRDRNMDSHRGEMKGMTIKTVMGADET